ncbi:putative ribonuclease H-like domain-containing protein [Tanacetum coccineum]|uniref:Ribonuclease H-like domain-containing protein n=1 Tax=Tanacetum coccineum TaxID=301880 RepID=A0ABQ4YJX7_9ASTR
MVPRAVLMKSCQVSLTTAKLINIAQPRTTVNSARLMTNVFNKAHSTVRRPINNKTTTKNSNSNQRINVVRGNSVNTARPKAVLNDVKGNQVNAVKASACWQDLQMKGVIDSGCLRHITGNMSYLTDFEEIDGGYVAFRGNPKGGKITGKVPRKYNMYSVDLKNIVTKGGLTCLFANVTSDESKLWHRRLGHINIKTMNKLVKENLVRGLPSKLFENNQTCVACQKGEQHRASSERKNRTLIEAAMTMLADSKLPTTFWAKAVNTACYVQNRVLVTKPHNKTPYELFMGIKPALGFMRPFGYHITILNTLDHLGKSNGNAAADPPFSQSLKSSPDARFKPLGDDENKDTDEPVIESGNPSKEGKSDEKEDDVNRTNNINTVSPTVNVADTDGFNAVNENIVIGCDDDPNMPELEVIGRFSDAEDDDSGADMNNLDTYFQSSTQTRQMTKNLEEYGFIGTTLKQRTNHKDLQNCLFTCFLSQEEPKKVVQALKDPRWIEAMQEELLQFKLQEVWTLVELPNRKRAIGTKWVFRNKRDERDVKSAFLHGMIEEEVYVCQPPGFEDPDFLNRVYKVEKALYGLHQAPRAWYKTLSTYLLYNRLQKGKIDKTLFIRRIKSDTLLVQVYVDDIIFGSTKKSLCIEFEKMMHKKFQMSSMGELTFFLGLQVKQKNYGIFISQDKYVTEILKKFGFTDVKTASTPMETQNPLLKDEDGEEVDVHMYRSMIGSLMYLTSSRPDIMFAVCACARYQVNLKVSYLHAVKRIFRYLKGQPKLGLWYLKDSPFDLVAYIDSYYAGASLDRKSTTGGYQFLGCGLISWQCKKQTVVANSTIEAEYVATSSCCEQVLWIQNQLLDYGYNFMHTKIFIDNNSTICIVKNLVFHSKIKHIEIRHHFIRDSNEKKLIQMVKIHTNKNVADLLTKAFDLNVNAAEDTHNMVALLEKPTESAGFEEIVDFLNVQPIKYALTINPTIYTSCIKQFWATAKVKTVNEEMQIHALVDGKKVIITESTVRRDLHLEDAEGVDCLPTTTIFEQLTLMGAKTTVWNEFSSTIASAIICLATNQKFNIFKYIFASMVKNLDSAGKFLMYPRFVQVFLDQQVGEMSTHNRIYDTPSHTKNVFGNMKRVGKGFSGRKQKPRRTRRKDNEIPQSSVPSDNVANETVNEEMDDSLVRDATTASSLEAEQDSGNILKTQSKATLNEPSSIGTSSGTGPRRQDTKGDTFARTRFERVSKLSNDLLLAGGNTPRSGEDSMKLQELMELCTNLQKKVLDLETSKTTQAEEISSLKKRVKKLERRNTSRIPGLKRLRKVGSARMIVSFDEASLGVTTGQDMTEKEVSTVDLVTTAGVEVSTASTILISAVPTTSTTTTIISDVEITLAQALDKGKAKMIQPEKPLKKKDQIMFDEEAMIDVDYQMAQQIPAEEQEQLSIEEKSKLFVQLLEARKKHFAALRAQEQRNKPPTKVQKRKTMSTYLKNMTGYKQNQLKNKSFDEIQMLFDKEMKRVNTFVDMDTELAKGSETRAESNADKEKEDLKQCFEIIPEEEVAINDIPLATKPAPIVDFQIHRVGRHGYYEIMGASGSLKTYLLFSQLLKEFDREDLENLWRLVKAKHGYKMSEESYERVLWGDLKVMFKPHVEDEVWRNLQGHKVLLWKLYQSCRVHFVRFENMHIYMLVEKKYYLTPPTITNMLNKKLQIDYWSEMCYQLLKLIIKQLKNP